MRDYVNVSRIFPTLTSVTCNMCGNKTSGVDANYGTEAEAEQYSRFHKVFGYFSKHFGDMTEVDFDLCEKCLKDIVDRCTIPVSIVNRLDP